jgi:hypothetical protein
MGFWDVIKKISQEVDVLAPVAAEFYAPAAPVLPVIQAALHLVNAATNGGHIDVGTVGLLNSLLSPYGLAVVGLPPSNTSKPPIPTS